MSIDPNPITTTVLALVAAVLVQLFKGLLRNRPEGEPDIEHGGKYYPRDFLAPGILVVMTGIGAGLGAYVGQDLVMWALAGFSAGAEAVGLYSGIKSLAVRAGVDSSVFSNGTLFSKN